MSEELKPCPFCGSKAFVKYEEGSALLVGIYCENTNCGIQPFTSLFDDLDETIKAWNTRQQVSEEKLLKIMDTSQMLYDKDHGNIFVKLQGAYMSVEVFKKKLAKALAKELS
jgi:hypothetical protein